MLIVCPSCVTSYDVELTSLGLQGRFVRCLRCRKVWHATPGRAEKLAAAAAALAPEGAVAAATTQPAAEFAAAPEVSGQTTWYEPPPDVAPGGGARDPESGPALTAVADDDGSNAEAPPIAPVDLDESRPPIDVSADDFAEHRAEPRTDVETAAARKWPRNAKKRRAARWPLPPSQSAVLALLLIDCILVGWRSDVVRVLPQTASFYALIGLPVNVRGLAFGGVTTHTEQHEGVPILVVDGKIINTAGKAVGVPRLKFVVRNAERQEIYSWTAVPPRRVVPRSKTISFRSRLASPPQEARDVVVRFVGRGDIVPATR